MNIDLKGIKVGKWRYINNNEMQVIKKMIAKSSNTKEASKIT